MRHAPEPPPLYAIADAGALAPRPLGEAVARLAAEGIGWIQVRAKELSGSELCHQVGAALEALAGTGATLWVDDRCDVAALFPVAGVHLGQGDLPAAEARRILGPEVWIGVSTHDLDQVEAAAREPEVDLIALGPIFPTASKEGADPPVGLEVLRRARGATGKPLVAIGGIGPENLGDVLAAGADSVAVLSGICRGDLSANCRRLLAAVGEAREAGAPGGGAAGRGEAG